MSVASEADLARAGGIPVELHRAIRARERRYRCARARLYRRRSRKARKVRDVVAVAVAGCAMAGSGPGFLLNGTGW